MSKSSSNDGESGLPAGAVGHSIGVERVLTRAAMDRRFRLLLLTDREAALVADSPGLSTAEAQILLLIPDAQLRDIVDRIQTPRASRRGFIKAVSTTMLAAMTGAGTMISQSTGCGSMEPDFHYCDGMRPDMDAYVPHIDASVGPDAGPCGSIAPGDYWINLGEHSAFMHLPPGYDPALPSNLCLAFHDQGRSSLSSVQVWRALSDEANFVLVALDWSGQPSDTWSLADSLDSYLYQLSDSYCIQIEGIVVATGVGTGATVALCAAMFESHRIFRAIALTGPLPTDWELRQVANPSYVKLWISMETNDWSYNSLRADLKALGNLGVTTRLVEVNDDREPIASDLATAWAWASEPLQ